MSRSATVKADKQGAKAQRAIGTVTGIPIAQVGEGLVLVLSEASRRNRDTARKDSARSLLPQLGKALSRPGLSRASVFTGAPGVFAYYADPEDPTLIVQEAEEGKRVTGRWANGCFQPL